MATPSSFNWKSHGKTSPVKDQLVNGAVTCNAGWAFATVAALESAQLIVSSICVTYSEQQLIDCSGGSDNHGCSGGLMSNSFEYLNNEGGINGDTDYAYTAQDGTC